MISVISTEKSVLTATERLSAGTFPLPGFEAGD
jgi:hypothetical protein